MKSFRILLSYRFTQWRNGLFKRDKREKTRWVISVIFSMIFMWLVWVFGTQVFQVFSYTSAFHPSYSHVLVNLPSVVFFLIFWMLALSALSIGIHNLYNHEEMAFLFTLPVSRRTIFLVRALESTLTNSVFFFFLGFPIVLAYGQTMHLLGIFYIIRIIPALVLFILFPTMIGLLAACVLMRLLPSNKTRDIFGALGIAIYTLTYLLFSISARGMDDRVRMMNLTGRFAEITKSSIYHLGPWGWTGSVVAGGGGILPLLWLLIVAVCFYAAVTWMIDPVYGEGWLQNQELATGNGGTRRRETKERGRKGVLQKFLGRPVYAIYIKDLLSLKRDMRQLSMLLIPIAIMFIYIFNMRTGWDPSMVTDSHANIILNVYIIMIGFILAPVSLRLTASSFLNESRAIWLAVSAPNDTNYILRAKLAYSMLLTLPFGILACLIMQFEAGFPTLMFIHALLFIIAGTLGFCAISVAGYAHIFDFNSAQPKTAISSGGQLILMACQMGFVILLSFGCILPWSIEDWWPSYALLFEMLSYIFAIGITWWIVLLCVKVGDLRFKHMEW